VAEVSLFDKFVARYGRLPTEYDSDYLEMLRMSKYRVMAVPDVQPGKCANCGASKGDGRKYIDIGVEVPWYGAIFFCSLCLADIGRHTGLFDELEEKLKAANEAVVSTNTLYTAGELLEEAIVKNFEEVKEYFDKLSAIRADLGSNRGVGLESYKEPSKSATGKGDRPALETEQRTTKSTPSSGSKDLLSLAERLKSGS
jgi:hypothetical protein